MMHSPPKAFRTPTRTSSKSKRHNYGAYDTKNTNNTWRATENPQLDLYRSPRKKYKQSHCHSAPSHIARYSNRTRNQVIISDHHNLTNTGFANNRANSEQLSSPISRRYQSQIGTALYDEDEEQNNTKSNLQSIIESPIRKRSRKCMEQSSPISQHFNIIKHNSYLKI